MQNPQSSDSVRRPGRPSQLELGEPFNPYKLFTGVFIPDALVRTPQISAGAKLAYGRLSRYAGEDGDCHPSVKTLARELGIKERQAQRYLSELQANGLVRSFPRFKAPNVRDTNGFVFLWHKIFVGSIRPSVSDLTPPPVSRTTPPPVSDVAPKENQIKENHLEESPSPSSVAADKTPRPAPPKNDIPDLDSSSVVFIENAAGRPPSLSEKMENLRTFLLKKFGKRFPHKAPGAKCLSDTLSALGNLGLDDLEAAIDARDADGPKIKSYGMIPLLARDAADWASAPQSDTETLKPKGGTEGEEEQRRRAYADMMEREKARKSPRQEWEEAQRRLHAK